MNKIAVDRYDRRLVVICGAMMVGLFCSAAVWVAPTSSFVYSTWVGLIVRIAGTISLLTVTVLIIGSLTNGFHPHGWIPSAVLVAALLWSWIPEIRQLGANGFFRTVGMAFTAIGTVGNGIVLLGTLFPDTDTYGRHP